MNDKTSKLVQWFLYALMGISALLGILFYAGAIDADYVIYWGYALLVILILTTLITAVSNLIQHPKGAIKLAIVLGAMVLIAIISYTLSTNNFTPVQIEKMSTSVSTSRIVGAGLYVTYVMFAAAILAIIYSAVSRTFK